MTWWPPDLLTLLISGFFLVLLLVGIGPRALYWLARQHDAFEQSGDRLRDFKYQRLVPLVGRLPISANVLTLLRPLLIWLSIFCFQHQFWPGFILAPYVLGWSTDYLDGLKARAEEDRKRQVTGNGKYKPSAIGKYLDPFADMVAMAFMTIGCWYHYPRAIIIAFAGAIIARTILFGILLFNRRHKPTWRQRFSSDILPKTISGEMKAGIIAMSFFLVLGWSNNATAVAWGSRLLVLAIIVEVVTLSYLVRTAIRMARMKVVEPLKKTGTEY